MAIGAVIFDYGMVLSTEADPAAHQELVSVFGASREDFEGVYWKYRHAYDEGKYNGDSYWRQCAATVGLEINQAKIDQLVPTDIRMWSNLNREMVDWAIAISKSGLKTGILSNIGFELADTFKEYDWVKGFTHNTWSCELGFAKPDPAIYHHVIDAIQTPASEVLFLDDRQENILSAEAVGLQGILFRDVPQLRQVLSERRLEKFLPPL